MSTLAAALKRRQGYRSTHLLRRRARDAIFAATARTDALATLSHEMREPLNGVLGMTRLLAETRLDSEQRSYVDSMLASAEGLTTLVNDVLDVARIDAGSVGLVSVDFSLPHLAQSIERMLRPRAQAKGLRLAVECEVEPEFVRGDPGRLRQVILNLAGNALKFTEAGEVSIGFAFNPCDDGSLELCCTVSDTGIGMAPGTFARLTAPWAQADPSVARLYGGSGLGLSIACRLLEAMGGGLACESENGRGTRFIAHCRLGAAVAADAGMQDRPGLLAGRSLLVVDEQERSRTTWRDLARLWGMDVRTAASGREGASLAREAADRQQPFDLAIIDGGLSEGSADIIAKCAQDDPRLSAMRLVLLAPSGFRGDAARAQEAGYAAYLPRSAEPETVRACLQQLLIARDHGAEDLVTVHQLSERRRRMNVLVVDDNELNGRLASVLLQRAGHDVCAVLSGEDALSTLLERSFDVVLMDMQMPIMDGLETTRRIRGFIDGQRARVPIVAVTANAMRGDDELCRDAGMDAYLTKPIDGASLVTTVERVGLRAA